MPMITLPNAAVNSQTRWYGVGSVVRRMLAQRGAALSLLFAAPAAALTEAIGVGVILLFLQGSTLPFALPGPLADFWAQMTIAPLNQRLQIGGLLAVGLFLMRGVLASISWFANNRLAAGVETAFRAAVFDQLMRRSVGDLQQHRQSELLTRLNDYPTESGLVALAIGNLLLNGVVALVYIAVVVLVNWQLALLAGLLMGLALLAVRWLAFNRLRAASKAAAEQRSEVNFAAFEAVTGYKLALLFNQRASLRERFGAALQRYQAALIARARWVASARPVFISFGVILAGGVLVIAAFLAPANDTTWLASAVLLIVVGFRLTNPMGAVNEALSQIQAYWAGVAQLEIYLAQPDSAPVASGSQRAEPLRQAIELQDVSVAFGQETVLQHLRGRITAGKVTALVGPSGSGKTTLINALTGIVPLAGGSILIDGQPLAELDLESWRAQLSVVSQETFLFNTSIYDNIRFAKPTATAAEVYIAARRADAHNFINDLPDGYRAIVGDRGMRLSGGQQQRISLARALLREPSLLILDEATSQLDVDSEARVRSALAAVSNQTVLLITHRPAVAQLADHVLVLVDGKIQEAGTPAYLKGQGGYFAGLLSNPWMVKPSN